jgi:Kef-type K+ transport system membrane component KefB
MEVADILIDLFILFAAARILGETFEAIGQPAVVGELLAGVLVGPHVLGLVTGQGEEQVVLDVIAELGVIILLFTVGLETSLGDLRRVGRSALLVGTSGVVLPFVAGAALMFALSYDTKETLFVAAALVATSVGVTARVLRDLGAVRTVVARVVLGAAVVDDILAITVLAVVAGIAQDSISEIGLVITFLEEIVFLAVVVFAGPTLVRRLSDLAHLPIVPGSPFAFAVLLTLGLAALSGYIGLASIIGAFLAGLIFEFRRDEVATQIEPVYEFLVPFFFAITGTRLDPGVFADPQILGLAVAVTIVAVVTKIAAGMLGGRRYGGRTARTIGVAMVPRAEVGLIVAAFGLSLGVISTDLYGVVLFMTVVTTIITPPVLSVLLRRHVLEAPGE